MLLRITTRRWFLMGILFSLAIAVIAFSPSRLTWTSARQQNVVGSEKPKNYPNLDVRVNAQNKVLKLVGRNRAVIMNRTLANQATLQKGVASLKAAKPDAEAKVSALTGAAEVVRSSRALTGPAPGRAGVEIIRGFIEDNSDLYGLSSVDIANLNFIGESVSRGSGMRMVRVEQVVNGLPVFQSQSRFILDRDGRVFRSTGLLVPRATETAMAINPDKLISAPSALSYAMASVAISMDAAHAILAKANAEGTKAEIVANTPGISGNVVSKLVYFPLAPGVLIPAWSQVTFTQGAGDWYTLVDATTGTLLWRKNIRDNASAHDARFRVYVQPDGTTPADNPAPLSPTTATVGSGLQGTAIAPTIVSMHTAMGVFSNVSQNGWIDDCPGGVCTANQTQTIGNNVHAYMDRTPTGTANDDLPDTDAGGVIDGGGKPTGNPDANTRNRDFLGTAPRDFQTNYLPPPQGGNPEAGQTSSGAGNNGTLAVDQFRRGMLTQLFYVTNWYHDRLFQLGFDEAAGNFQQLNFSGMGLGADRVLAEGQDGHSVDNANFSTPPDGQSGRAQMFRFTGPTIDRDGALDSEILIHELTHGLSNRLIGDGAGLNWDPGGGMGEGWSDFYALSLLNNTNADDPNGNYAMGAYATYKAFGVVSFTDNYLYAIRRFPYSTNNSVNPLTWADVDDYTNNLSGGIAPDPLGSNLGGALEVHNAGEVWALTLWEVRSRVIAANAGNVPVGNQIMLQLVTDALKMTPISPSYTDARDALVDADCATNACANEQLIWDGFADRGLGYGARVSSAYGFAPVATHQGIVESFSTPYLDVQSISVVDNFGNNNGTIDPGETIRLFVTLRNPWRTASKGVASATATLTSSTPGVVITDGNSTFPAIPAQGSAAGDQFRFNIPQSATCGQQVKFTITSTSTLGVKGVDFAFRVGAPSGTDAPITYTRTPAAPLPIEDNRPRGVIDSQTITDDFQIADLNFRVDSITHSFPGDLTVGFKAPNGYGVDLVSFIGGALGEGDGDDITNMLIDNQAAGDMLLATDGDAPYTGSWLPIANSPTWPLVGFGPEEPVGELNKLNGASTQGTWQVLVADEALQDDGTFNSWSLIITPVHFVCTGPVTAAPATISGRITTPDGNALAGVTLNLSGDVNRRAITDSNGNYRFNGVETSRFYTVTPSLTNYHFGPESRSFSLLANQTDAVFTATRDAVIGGNAIDSEGFFVRQHYLDFLSREPDESGFNFWINQILACGGDAGCRERRTINTSAAYFLSIEFQNTGGLVDGMYRASYGRRPMFAEFMPDTATVARNVVVGDLGWAQTLDANKRAFAESWVQRAEFQTAYGGLTNEGYVDALVSHTGVDFSADERSSLVNGLNSGTSTRADVLRAIAENERFTAAKRNEAFVMMQYFGYLRRDPDAAGYQFWLNKLNQFGGNFEQAEMVKSFLVSGEYRDRFRQ
jgi:subtilisin-like proprotein convertase family protein